MKFDAAIPMCAALSLLCGACPSSSSEPPTAEESCELVVDALCDRLTECGETIFHSKAEQQTYFDRCVPHYVASFRCNAASAVTPYLDECMSELRTAGCVLHVANVSEGGGLSPAIDVPQECNGVVKVE